jgi:hypothetical protein
LLDWVVTNLIQALALKKHFSSSSNHFSCHLNVLLMVHGVRDGLDAALLQWVHLHLAKSKRSPTDSVQLVDRFFLLEYLPFLSFPVAV